MKIRVMRICSAIGAFILLFQHSLLAANVQWGVLQSALPDSHGDVLVSSICQGLDVSFYIGVAYGIDDPFRRFVFASPNTNRAGTIAPINGYVSGAWANANDGDVVDKAAVFDHDVYFFNETYGSVRPDSQSLITVEFEIDKSWYFMFVMQNEHEVVEYVSGCGKDPSSLYFGWAECVVGKDGVFSIVNSAIDLDGGAMIVGGGAIPEPTGGWLVVVGLAIIALRRRYRLAGVG